MKIRAKSKQSLQLFEWLTHSTKYAPRISLSGCLTPILKLEFSWQWLGALELSQNHILFSTVKGGSFLVLFSGFVTCA